MRVVIIGGGSCETDFEFKDSDYVICADHGYDHALKYEIVPDLLIGDMDSVIADADSFPDKLVLPVRKDFTDSETAVRHAMDMHPDEIVLLGFTGTRMDHTLGNIFLLKLLDEKNIPFDKNTEIGIIIETPAAAVISDELAKHCDFFSIGTNDLTQYTTACDRQNPYLDKFSDTENTAILRLIEYTAKSAHDNGIWVGICGELAADTSLTEKFLKIGIDELSVTPSFVLKVRDKVRKIKLEG